MFPFSGWSKDHPENLSIESHARRKSNGLAMTSRFYQAIYHVVQQIPPGQLATYGQVAALAGKPGAARQVGYALHALPAGHDLPWHRVLNAQGRISFSDPHAVERQRLLLEQEGVSANERGIFNLAQYRWQPDTLPSDDGACS